MKRDMDLIRELLQQIEASPTSGHTVEIAPGREYSEVHYHMTLLNEAGYVRDWAPDAMVCGGLTWPTYEFIEATRNESVWNNAKGYVIQKTGGLAISALLAYAKHELAIRSGISIDVDNRE